MEGLDKNVSTKSNETEPEQYTVYRKRWLMLFLYWIYCAAFVIHWLQYSVIADVTVKYYSVSYHAVEWTSMVFSILYILFFIPGSYILDKLGIRTSLLIGITGTCVGSWLKVVAVHPDRFWLVLLSQCIIAIFKVLVLPVPPKLAAVWFGANELSFASAMAAVAFQFAWAFGFIIPTLLVKQGDMETMQIGFYKINCSFAVTATVVIVLLYFFFEDKPPTPPSFAQEHLQETTNISFDYKNSLLNVIKNKSFVLLLLIYGVHLGTSIALPILLNQMILDHYPNASKHIGYIGLLITFSGIVGSTIYGVVITKFGGLKFISWFVFINVTLVTLSFVFLIGQGLLVVYILAILMGAFWSCIYCVGFELGAELTYPEPEAAAGGILVNSFQLFGVAITYLYSYFYNDVNKLYGNLFLMVILLLANIGLFFIKFDLKRTDAEKSNIPKSRVI